MREIISGCAILDENPERRKLLEIYRRMRDDIKMGLKGKGSKEVG
jgi:hypothetical protein